MKIEQFEDKGLAHFAYAILSESRKEIVLIDPARNPQPYYDFAQANQARITAVIETHPHADFVSSHLEIHKKTGAPIYAHSLVAADYPHQPFDDGATLVMGNIGLSSLHTPGHSPDSISVLLRYHGKEQAVFTGDTLFIGDVGRPDLRESAGSVTAMREELARQMYHSTRQKLMTLPDTVVVYPAHGAGTLCGKALSHASSSAIGAEKATNPALQQATEQEFVEYLTADQPFIPKYFGYNVALNKKGAPDYKTSVDAVKRLPNNHRPGQGALVVDSRPQLLFRKGHQPGAINIPDGGKFETWLGSIIGPDETFYLVAASESAFDTLLGKAAKIGYESKVLGVFALDGKELPASAGLELGDFRKNPQEYTIVDVRNASEVKEKQYFKNSLNIPLPELRERAAEVPPEKPVVVHCAGGYRSAVASSILENALPTAKVLDLGDNISTFTPLQ